MSDIKTVLIDYVNYKGVQRWREVAPISIWYGSTEYHPTPGWLLKAEDCGTRKIKDFRMSDIKEWRD